MGFGIAGTIIEKVSGVRFDIFAKQNILEKLGIDGSYNVADITDYWNIAVLYDGSSG